MAGKKSQQDHAETEAPSFEGAIVELQRIVGQLEDGSLPLEESMEQFERGISLLRNCYKVLEQAEQRIEVLTSVAEDGTSKRRLSTHLRHSPRRPRRGLHLPAASRAALTNRQHRNRNLVADQRPTNRCSEPDPGI